MENDKREEFEYQVRFNERMIEQAKKDAFDSIQDMIDYLEGIKRAITEGRIVNKEDIRQPYGQQSAIRCIEKVERVEIENSVLKMMLKED